MVRLARKQAILAKSEAVYGVDSVPAAATDAIAARETSPEQDINFVDTANVTSSLSSLPGRVGRILNTGSLEFDLTHHGRANVGDILDPIRIDPLLQAAGLIPAYTAESAPGANDGDVTYAFDSDNPVSQSLYMYKDTVLYKFLGCYNSLTFRFVPGETPVLAADVRGLYSTPTDVANPVPTFDEVLPPIVENMLLSIGGYTPVCRNVELMLNVEIPERPDVNSPKGLKGLIISMRNPELSLSVEATTEADKAFWQDMEDGTLEAVSFLVTSTAMGTITFTLPTCQVTNLSHSNNDGILTYDVTSRVAGTDSGDDELTIKFE